jgi:hypothetical protein
MHPGKRDYSVLESAAMLISNAVDWMSTERRASGDRPIDGQKPG